MALKINRGGRPLAAEQRAQCDDPLNSSERRPAGGGLDVRCEASPEVPAQVLGDPLRLRQVLVNLIGNAIKFADRGYVVAKAQVEVDEVEAVRLEFSVQDTGPGIPEDGQGHIFQSFCQAVSSISRKHGGTGLGLTISSRLVEMMAAGWEALKSVAVIPAAEVLNYIAWK